MAQTRAGIEKAERTLIEKFGSKEAVTEWRREIGRLGGNAERTKPSLWQLRPDLAQKAGRKGGKSRHGKR